MTVGEILITLGLAAFGALSYTFTYHWYRYITSQQKIFLWLYCEKYLRSWVDDKHGDREIDSYKDEVLGHIITTGGENKDHSQLIQLMLDDMRTSLRMCNICIALGIVVAIGYVALNANYNLAADTVIHQSFVYCVWALLIVIVAAGIEVRVRSKAIHTACVDAVHNVK